MNNSEKFIKLDAQITDKTAIILFLMLQLRSAYTQVPVPACQEEAAQKEQGVRQQ